MADGQGTTRPRTEGTRSVRPPVDQKDSKEPTVATNGSAAPDGGSPTASSGEGTSQDLQGVTERREAPGIGDKVVNGPGYAYTYRNGELVAVERTFNAAEDRLIIKALRHYADEVRNSPDGRLAASLSERMYEGMA